uniref:Uncharacterized protein n=1 Tax=Marmota marmota marmota TaxID=9994 RepID=A0A8C5ZAC6_MARMA
MPASEIQTKLRDPKQLSETLFQSKKVKRGRAWWRTPVIPAIWEAKTGGSYLQQIEVLSNSVRPCL